MTRQLPATVCAVILSVPWAASAAANKPAAPPPAGPSINVLFTPQDDCIQAIVEELNAAQKTIRVQAYFMTSDRIGMALITAQAQGVDVQVILDAGLADCAGTEAQKLADNHVSVRVDAAHTRAHSKVIVIDAATVITGEVEFSRKQQPLNAENMLIFKGFPDIARKYTLNWGAHAKHSIPLAKLDTVFRNKPVALPNPAGAPPAAGAAPDPHAKPAAAVNAQARQNGELVYVTHFGRRYHRKDCRHIRTGAQSMTLPEAVAAGKTPCKVCKPN